MEKIETCQKVVMIMTKGYKAKVDTRTGGAGYGYQIITSEMAVKMASNSKCIPVLREGDSQIAIPTLLQQFQYLDMRDDKLFEQLYLELLRSIYDEPLVKRPEMGKKPPFDTKLANPVNTGNDNNPGNPKNGHDIIANSLYRLLVEIESDMEVNREKIMDRIDNLYQKSRDSSYGKSGFLEPEFQETISRLLSSFQNDRLKITISGNHASVWNSLSKPNEYEIKAILQEIMVIMNQQRNASHIHWRFERTVNHILISYGNNCPGNSSDQPVVDSLSATKNRLESINGKMDHSPVFNEIRIQVPAETDHQPQNTGKIPDYGSELSVFDITVVELLSQGVVEKSIPGILHSKNLRLSGLSSVEKRLNFIKQKYSLNSNSEIVTFFKNHGLI